MTLAKAVAVAALAAPLFMTGPASAGSLLSPEELLAIGTVKSFNYLSRNVQHQTRNHYAYKKCELRYKKVGVSPSSIARRCRHVR